ncbi:hypothetical protein [Photobacterium leiognathi]|uniref:hypothetical protein n=1 Tax=Photobacterium leiognathi TaxID=553611 RepID=UPI00298154DE|nr:hypothetical protein [Photobacterium leiognathi]
MIIYLINILAPLLFGTAAVFSALFHYQRGFDVHGDLASIIAVIGLTFSLVAVAKLISSLATLFLIRKIMSKYTACEISLINRFTSNPIKYDGVLTLSDIGDYCFFELKSGYICFYYKKPFHKELKTFICPILNPFNKITPDDIERKISKWYAELRWNDIDQAIEELLPNNKHSIINFSFDDGVNDYRNEDLPMNFLYCYFYSPFLPTLKVVTDHKQAKTVLSNALKEWNGKLKGLEE